MRSLSPCSAQGPFSCAYVVRTNLKRTHFDVNFECLVLIIYCHIPIDAVQRRRGCRITERVHIFCLMQISDMGSVLSRCKILGYSLGNVITHPFWTNMIDVPDTISVVALTFNSTITSVYTRSENCALRWAWYGAQFAGHILFSANFIFWMLKSISSTWSYHFDYNWESTLTTYSPHPSNDFQSHISRFQLQGF